MRRIVRRFPSFCVADFGARHYLPFISGVNRYSSPLSFISYSVSSSIPSLPCGNPLPLYQLRYGSGSLYSGTPLYFPYGISLRTMSINML